MNHHQAAQSSIDTHASIAYLANAIAAGYRPAPGSPEMYQILDGMPPDDMTVGQFKEWMPGKQLVQVTVDVAKEY